jgi:serine/threonine protein phosphatase 1
MLERDQRIPSVPDDWDLWAFTDAHGMTSALVAGLQSAGLIDADRRWVAPPRTALVGCGDYLDRGGDVRGLVQLLQRLEQEAPARGGVVHLARGNHEAMPLMIRGGSVEWLEVWREYGGDATLAAFGCPDPDDVEQGRLLGLLELDAPDLFAWLERLPQAVRWRDVLFVHGGLPPHGSLADLGITTDEHLWIRSGFFERPWDDRAFDAYRAEGIGRVVFGHTPQPTGPTFFHDGRSIDIDTNAVGNPDLPDGSSQALTLLGLSGHGSFASARIITVPTGDAPERMRRVGERAD